MPCAQGHGRLAGCHVPATLRELRDSGWESVPVKEELRRNAVAKIRAGEALFPGVLGYEDTVLPQLENALLAGHDVIFLGERGQAKTRMIRSLVGLLDEWLPIVAGSEINDDPYAPVSAARPCARRRARRRRRRSTGSHRDTRFGEKLATPDTSIADLIGEVDPIKVAEGRYLSDELTLHYGLVPRTNRGIFAINELPDLAERIQVGLLNVLEERDVQVRGYKVRLPLDVLPRRLGQPRGLHQPRPHHHAAEGPLRRPDPHALPARDRDRDRHRRAGGARRSRRRACGSRCPPYLDEVVATLSHLARQSPHVNQRSGRVGAPHRRQPRDARRQRRPPGARASARPTSCPRIADLEALASSTQGKIEIESRRRGPRRPGRRAPPEGGGADGVPRPAADRAAPRRARGVRRRRGRAHRRRRRRRPTRPRSSRRSPRCGSRCSSSPAATSRRPPSPAPSSSCSRACTSQAPQQGRRRRRRPPTAAAT